jgi:hypothetical protein
VRPHHALPAVRRTAYQRCTSCESLRYGLGRGNREWPLNDGQNPKLSRRTCTWAYGLQSCRGESAGVAKRSRELTRNPYPQRATIRNDSQLLHRCVPRSISHVAAAAFLGRHSCRTRGMSAPRLLSPRSEPPKHLLFFFLRWRSSQTGPRRAASWRSCCTRPPPRPPRRRRRP